MSVNLARGRLASVAEEACGVNSAGDACADLERLSRLKVRRDWAPALSREDRRCAGVWCVSPEALMEHPSGCTCTRIGFGCLALRDLQRPCFLPSTKGFGCPRSCLWMYWLQHRAGLLVCFGSILRERTLFAGIPKPHLVHGAHVHTQRSVCWGWL